MMRSLVVGIGSALWLGLLALGVAWPITIGGTWLVAAALRKVGFRVPRHVFEAALFLTYLGAAVMGVGIVKQIRIARASSCEMQGNASTLASRTTIVAGPDGARAIVRLEDCDYGFGVDGVVKYVFIALPHGPHRKILVLRYTANDDDTDETSDLVNPPQVRWTANTLHVVVPSGTIYALTYRKTHVGHYAIDYDMRPEEDYSSMVAEILEWVVFANVFDLLL